MTRQQQAKRLLLFLGQRLVTLLHRSITQWLRALNAKGPQSRCLPLKDCIADARQSEAEARTGFESFFARAPRMNPARGAITGVVCGARVETIEEPLMREIRYLDKLVDELARGKRMEKILREGDRGGVPSALRE
ncbi:MAG TPA: DUF2200 family protein [Allosphingosinicella sp.]|nr:DUF2200 family protein [Allosphingosinicella sp.]